MAEVSSSSRSIPPGISSSSSTHHPDSAPAHGTLTGREPTFSLSALSIATTSKSTDLLSQEAQAQEDDLDDDAPFFTLPVDSEHKAKKLKLWSASPPHMRAFHLSWISFFSSFLSSFAAAPLLPVIRDNLDLTKQDIGNAGTASVAGSILSRVIMGALCDMVGPRYACAILIVLTAPAVFGMASVTSATGFLLSRFFTGFSLATFVSCQFWMSSMFAPGIVGTVNGTTAGWANLGGGATLLVMPFIYRLFQERLGFENFTAWRLAFFVPGAFQILTAFMVVKLGQDLPDGNYHELKQKGNHVQDTWFKVVIYAIVNPKVWVFALSYGYCFGVELTVDNIIAEYFFDSFDLSLHIAGIAAAAFGLANIVTRPFGGILSDWMAYRLGMRGRLWTLWVLQTGGGFSCIVLGRVNKLGGAIVVLVIFSFFAEAACGATFGIIPFVSHRSLGVSSGIIGAGGMAGAIVTQLIFFTSPAYSTAIGISLMGIMIVCCTLPVVGVYFPQWGGMLRPASRKPEATEESYYAKEWSREEQEKGMHEASLKFAENSRGERGKPIALFPAPGPIMGAQV